MFGVACGTRMEVMDVGFFGVGMVVGILDFRNVWNGWDERGLYRTLVRYNF